jgi:2-keto-4-pentenoate hydratase/2-oxohepta-3-ene-1,7-dioic acid hydratase in catechol pathway
VSNNDDAILTHSAPILFYKPLHALIGPLAPIRIPPAAQPVAKHLPDYEVELTIVIGKAARDVSEADALDYVLGYTVANDVRTRRPSLFWYRVPMKIHSRLRSVSIN